MATTLNWFGDEVTATIHTEMKKRLARLGIAITTFAAINLKKKQNRDGKTPGAPGGYPAEFTSQLAKQVASSGWEFLEEPRLGIRWGTNLKHGRWQETGTRNMAPRPWMSLTNQAMISQMIQILGSPPL